MQIIITTVLILICRAGVDMVMVGIETLHPLMVEEEAVVVVDVQVVEVSMGRVVLVGH